MVVDMIDNDVILGNNVKIFDEKLVNIFGCDIGDNSFIGPFVEITRGVKIGVNCIIQSHSFICTGVTIEDGVFIGHGVMFVNDLFPRTNRHVEYRNTLVKAGASLGTGSVIVGGVTLGKYCVVGAGAVVTKDVSDYSINAGNPACELRRFSDYEEMSAYMSVKQASVVEKNGRVRLAKL
jgi:UDP-2-acetamido-3-amino-2,3-dideoxy-glucuronate N-acetyltransferase